jgi:hypothetical protein
MSFSLSRRWGEELTSEHLSDMVILEFQQIPTMESPKTAEDQPLPLYFLTSFKENFCRGGATQSAALAHKNSD